MLRTLKWMLSILPVMVAVTVPTAGCHRKPVPVEQDDIVVVAYGDTAVMLREVVHQIPRGLEPEDSVAMFRAIVETWLRREVLTDYAARNLPDIEEVERIVEQYRSDLILSRYLARVDRSVDPNVSGRRVEKTLARMRDSMILDEPVVKGIFLKVGEDDSNLGALRRWMKTSTDYSVDKLEHDKFRGATQYEYFMDRWHPWHEVADLIPYRFDDADAFLEAHRDFETQYGGSVYIIHISDYVSAGSKMPSDYARQLVGEMLLQEDVAGRRQEIVRDVYRREESDGRLRKGLYDPATGRLTNDKNGKNDNYE